MPNYYYPESGTSEYYIQDKDTLYLIAQRYGITIDAIVNANPGIDPTKLIKNQKIYIPTKAPEVPVPCTLLLVPAHSPGSYKYIGGVIVKQYSSTAYLYTIVASELPLPNTLGKYDSYLAEIRIQNRPHWVLLSYVASKYPVWTGSIILPFPPGIGDIIVISPNGDRITGEGILGGVFGQCSEPK